MVFGFRNFSVVTYIVCAAVVRGRVSELEHDFMLFFHYFKVGNAQFSHNFKAETICLLLSYELDLAQD